jgi:hypothetical protein
LKVRPPILNREVLTFNEAHFGQALAKCISQKIEFTRRRAIEESDDRLRLLRSCRKRPRRRADERDELAPMWLIEWHTTPPVGTEDQDIELARVSQEVFGNVTARIAGGGSSRNVRHKQPVRHPLLEVEHRRLASRYRTRERLAWVGKPSAFEV